MTCIKYRLGDVVGFISTDGRSSLTVVESICQNGRLWGRWFNYKDSQTYTDPKEVELYIPKEYC